MRGDPQIVDRLKQQLTLELTAMDLYFLQARHLDHRGFKRLAARLEHESGDERRHATALADRILVLGGCLDVVRREAATVPSDVIELLRSDLDAELAVRASLTEAIALCLAKGDHGTREILERLLDDTENDHIHWFESLLRQIADVGREQWLAEQL